MAFIEFGPRPSRKPFQPTEQQIANAHLGAVSSDSRVGQEMIRRRNSNAPATVYHQIADTVRTHIEDTTRSVVDRTKQIVKDAGPAAVVVGATVTIAALAGCDPGLDGGSTPDDGGGAGQTPSGDDGAQKFLECHEEASKALAEWVEAHPGEPVSQEGYAEYYEPIVTCDFSTNPSPDNAAAS